MLITIKEGVKRRQAHNTLQGIWGGGRRTRLGEEERVVKNLVFPQSQATPNEKKRKKEENEKYEERTEAMEAT